MTLEGWLNRFSLIHRYGHEEAPPSSFMAEHPSGLRSEEYWSQFSFVPMQQTGYNDNVYLL